MHKNELISFVILCVALLVSSVMQIIKKCRKNKTFVTFTPTKIFIFGFAAALSAYIFFASDSGGIINIIDNGFKTFRSVKGYFKIDYIPSEFGETVKSNQAVSSFGKYYFLFLNLVIPFITLRIFYSAFRDYLTSWIYFFAVFRKFHIFSDLNEKTISLAEDIFANEKNCTIIFTNV